MSILIQSQNSWKKQLAGENFVNTCQQNIHNIRHTVPNKVYVGRFSFLFLFLCCCFFSNDSELMWHVLDKKIWLNLFLDQLEVAQFIMSSKGHAQLVDKLGYIYNKHQNSQNGITVWWKCSEYYKQRPATCKARATTEGFSITKFTNSHTHSPPELVERESSRKRKKKQKNVAQTVSVESSNKPQ